MTARRTSRVALFLFRFPRLRRWMHKVSAPWRPVGTHIYDGSPESLAAVQAERRDWIEAELGPRRMPFLLYCAVRSEPAGCASDIVVGVSGGGVSDRQEACERAASAGWYWRPFERDDIACPACHLQRTAPTDTASHPTPTELGRPHEWVGPASGSTHCLNCGELPMGDRAHRRCLNAPAMVPRDGPEGFQFPAHRSAEEWVDIAAEIERREFENLPPLVFPIRASSLRALTDRADGLRDDLDVRTGPVIEGNPSLIVEGALDGATPAEVLARLTGRTVEEREQPPNIITFGPGPLVVPDDDDGEELVEPTNSSEE